MLAGHTHGGQIRFPAVGPIVCPSRYGVRYASGVFDRAADAAARQPRLVRRPSPAVQLPAGADVAGVEERAWVYARGSTQ